MIEPMLSPCVLNLPTAVVRVRVDDATCAMSWPYSPRRGVELVRGLREPSPIANLSKKRKGTS